MSSTKDALLHLRYAPGIAAEYAIAYWLLSQGGPAFGAAALLAYVLLTTATGVLLFGLFWYWVYFAERGAGGRYLLGLCFPVGIALTYAAGYLIALFTCGTVTYGQACADAPMWIGALLLIGMGLHCATAALCRVVPHPNDNQADVRRAAGGNFAAWRCVAG